jgi:hypothetical protein
MLVDPKHSAFSGNQRERAEHGVRRTEYFTARQDQLNRLCKGFAWNRWKPLRHLLKRGVSNTVAREGAPATNPKAAEATIPVVNEHRLFGIWRIHGSADRSAMPQYPAPWLGDRFILHEARSRGDWPRARRPWRARRRSSTSQETKALNSCSGLADSFATNASRVAGFKPRCSGSRQRGEKSRLEG